MTTATEKSITVEASIQAPVEKVWKYWSEPKHITKWCQASDDWHAPYAENDLRTDGKFKTTMAAKDGIVSFDFEGVYTKVRENEIIEYTMGDGRKVSILFSGTGHETKVTETFDAENSNSADVQPGMAGNSGQL